MSNVEGSPIYPVIGWDIGPLTEHNAITVRLECLDMATMQRNMLPFVALTRPQLNEFLVAIQTAVAKLEASQTDTGTPQ